MERIRQLTTAGVFSGLALALMFLEFPIFPQANFLKYDPSEIVVFVSTTAFSLKVGILVVIVKDILFYFLKSGDLIGIVMNMVAGIVFAIFTYSFFKRFEKIGGILVASIVTLAMVALNAVVVPLYFKAPFELFLKFLPFIIAFNLIKFSVNYYIGLIVHKKLKNVLRLV